MRDEKNDSDKIKWHLCYSDKTLAMTSYSILDNAIALSPFPLSVCYVCFLQHWFIVGTYLTLMNHLCESFIQKEKTVLTVLNNYKMYLFYIEYYIEKRLVCSNQNILIHCCRRCVNNDLIVVEQSKQKTKRNKIMLILYCIMYYNALLLIEYKSCLDHIYFVDLYCSRGMDKSNVYQTYKSKTDYKLFTEMNKHEKNKLSNYLNSDNSSFSLTKSYIVYYIIFFLREAETQQCHGSLSQIRYTANIDNTIHMRIYVQNPPPSQHT